MAEGARILETIDSALAARTRGDKEGVARYLAPGAQFRIVGDPAQYPGFPLSPADAAEAVAALIDRVRFHNLERIDAIVEGHRAACRWRIDVSLGEGQVAPTEVCDLWSFDEEGRITELVQFIDTALLARLLTEA
jgi:ketosteroid isomerase-like protein